MDGPIEEKERGRILALDIGSSRVGVAVSDELQITVRPLASIKRGSWKQLLRDIKHLVAELRAQAIVIGLPLRLDGTEGNAAIEMREMARKFRLSLTVPVHLHDERLTTFLAQENLKAGRNDAKEIADRLDSEAAAIILRDFIENKNLERAPADE